MAKLTKARVPRIPSEGVQKVQWGRLGRGDLPQVCYVWGPGQDMKVTARVISTAFEGAIVHDGKTLVEVLEDRGYDITTLRFSVEKLPTLSQGEKP